MYWFEWDGYPGPSVYKKVNITMLSSNFQRRSFGHAAAFIKHRLLGKLHTLFTASSSMHQASQMSRLQNSNTDTNAAGLPSLRVLLLFLSLLFVHLRVIYPGSSLLTPSNKPQSPRCVLFSKKVKTKSNVLPSGTEGEKNTGLHGINRVSKTRLADLIGLGRTNSFLDQQLRHDGDRDGGRVTDLCQAYLDPLTDINRCWWYIAGVPPNRHQRTRSRYHEYLIPLRVWHDTVKTLSRHSGRR